MRFLQAKKLDKPGKEENKMKPGTRPDQKNAPRGDLQPIRGESAPAPKPEVVELAKSLGVELLNIKGSGKDGAITLKDVRDAKTAADEAFKDK